MPGSKKTAQGSQPIYDVKMEKDVF
ncbi:MAG: hypothetical protein H6Q55_2150, partial [Deltaproteobacteria bacterium]|nr:hypothetical protein [Deltaproteobacteria bacterium]